MRAYRLVLLLVAFAAWPVAGSAQTTGSFSGTVTSASGTPLQGVTVIVCTTSGTCSFAPTTNASGAYTFTGAPGTYFAGTSNNLGFIDEIYDNLRCFGSCSLSQIFLTGTPIQVTAGQNNTGRNFALDLGGTVTGTVTASGTSTGLSGVVVQIYARTATGSATFVRSASTNSSGAYSVSGIPTGTAYFAFTSNSTGFVNEIYDNIQCPGSCSSFTAVSLGTAISVTEGGTTSAINFALDPGGTITGTVTASSGGAPLQSVSVFAYTVSGTTTQFAGSAGTNASGSYSIGGLPTGTYYLLTSNSLGYINEIFDNIMCPGSCNTGTLATVGTPVTVTTGQTTSGRNFALDVGGSIAGTVTNSATSAAVPSTGVFIYSRSGTSAVFVSSASTNSTGQYTVGGLPTGTYYVFTSVLSQVNLVDEIYNNIQCPGSCNPTTAVNGGTAISVTQGSAASGIDFALDPGGEVRGIITASANGAALANVSVQIYTRVGTTNTFAGSGFTNSSGEYAVPGLPTGTYFAYTTGANTQGFVNEIFDNLPCPGFCQASLAVGGGTPISVTAGSATTGRNFALDTGGTITGTVRDAGTSAGLNGIVVNVVQNLAGVISSVGTVTSATGAYSIGGLPAGVYYLFTSGSGGYTNQIFQNVACPGSCNSLVAIANGTPVTVTAGAATSGRDFSLSAGGTISGIVTSTTGSPIPSAFVTIVTRAGSTWLVAGTASTNSAGVYAVSGLAAGTYFAFASAGLGFVSEYFDNLACPSAGCSAFEAINAGTPIALTAGGTVGGRNFALTPVPATAAPGQPTGLSVTIANATAVFSWFEPSTTTGGAPTGYDLEVGFAPGQTAVVLQSTTTSYTASGVPPGRFFARVRARNAAGRGPASAEIEFGVNADGSGVPNAPFGVGAYMVGSRLYMTWSQPTTGGVATGFIVEAGTSSGAANIAALPVGSRTFFTFDPVPPGFYFLRVRATNGASVSRPSTEVMLVVGGAPSPPDAPINFGAAANAARTVTLGWAAPRGTVLAYIVEAGSAFGLSDIAVFNTGSSATTISFPNVPPGVYYVRVRAVNAAGASVATGDVRLVVP